MKKLLSSFASIVIAVTAAGQSKCTVYFDSNKSDLTTAAAQTLDSVALLLSGQEAPAIDIKGYCDNTGGDPYNQVLSEARVKTVSDYFGGKKLPVIASQKGYGKSSPVADNATEAGKAKNRRVEISFSIKTKEILAAPQPEIKEIKKEKPEKTPGKQEELSDNISLENIPVGKILVLKNLNFVGGTPELLNEAFPSLELLLKVMKDNPTLEIEIEGHVCCANDMPLSIARAMTVYRYLIRNGISETRLRYQGHSNFQPLTDERDEEERIINRRVEIKIMKK